ncbi:MAG TPA: nuclear transport factor 2 family protein [Candidatus Glassbacteria bacterium]|nr:nuclear transport factor 2 family protein [Candidatus Glassbacteria bacterium]
MPPASEKAANAARNVISAINRAWREGRFAEIEGYFHPQAVLVVPGFTMMVEGAGACAKSYEDFAGQANISNYEESDVVVEVWGDTAVADYRFEIGYEINDRKYDVSGRDLFALIRRKGRWLAAWRTLMPIAEED